MKKTLKTQLSAAVAMMIVAAIALTGATYAWFTAIANPEVGQIDLYVKAADTLMLSELDAPDVDTVDDWKVTISEADITAAQATAFPENMENVSTLFNDTSSDFYTALHDTKGAITGYSAISQVGNYAKFSLNVKSTNTGYIYLDTGSAVTTSETGPKASISQTVRVGFVPVSGTTEQWDKAVIWEPNSTAHLADTYGGPTETGKLDYDGVKSAATVEAATSYDFVTDKTNIALDSTKIGLFNYTQSELDKAQKFNVYIWVEGADKDTVNAVAKSTFLTYLRFGQAKGSTLS